MPPKPEPNETGTFRVNRTETRRPETQEIATQRPVERAAPAGTPGGGRGHGTIPPRCNATGPARKDRGHPLHRLPAERTEALRMTHTRDGR